MILTHDNLLAFLPATKDEIDLNFEIRSRNPHTEEYETDLDLKILLNKLIMEMLNSGEIIHREGCYDKVREKV